MFADSTGPDLVPQLVPELARLGIRATFFLSGRRTAADVVAVGVGPAARDEIGIAGPDTAPGWLASAELTLDQHRLLLARAPATSLVRPAGITTAKASSRSARAAALRLVGLGYVVVLPDLSAQRAVSGAAVLAALAPPHQRATTTADSQAAAPPGLILELPDAGRGGAAALAALPALAAGLRADGYRFATVSGACGLVFRHAHVSLPAVAAATAVLIAASAAGWLTTAVGWAFAIALLIVASRCLLLVVTGGYYQAWARRRRLVPWRGPVSVVIPAYNEAQGVERCLRSMAASEYDELEVILVDDGSTDGTADIAEQLGLPVTIVRQPNAGKAAALNEGIRHASHEVLVFADGDTVFEPATVAELVAPFSDPVVGAVAGNVKVASRSQFLGRIQHTEYVLASSLDRRMYDVLDCMTTIPGAAGAFRRTAIIDAGGVQTDTLAEDTDLTIAIGLAGWRIRYAATARAWTETPATLRQLWSQRHRWNYGMLQVLWKYRRLLIAPRNKRTLAWVGLPYLFAMGCVLPLVSPMADLYIVLDAWLAPRHAAGIWLGFLVLQFILTLYAFVLDSERLRALWTLPVQLVLYRQFMYLVMIHALATALAGVRLRWHKLTRTGVEVRQT